MLYSCCTFDILSVVYTLLVFNNEWPQKSVGGYDERLVIRDDVLKTASIYRMFRKKCSSSFCTYLTAISIDQQLCRCSHCTEMSGAYVSALLTEFGTVINMPI